MYFLYIAFYLILIVKIIKQKLSNERATPAAAVDINFIKYYAKFVTDFGGNPLDLRQYIDQVQNTFLENPKVPHIFVLAHASQILKALSSIRRWPNST